MILLTLATGKKALNLPNSALDMKCLSNPSATRLEFFIGKMTKTLLVNQMLLDPLKNVPIHKTLVSLYLQFQNSSTIFIKVP